ncbi:hypothetical protein XH98_20485 [Bradyrhizobium sp. CCBAU 51745]|nr:hypothetical protein [Bradyrhizobium sp. CCBAU 51745]
MASAFFNFNRKRLIAVASQQLLPSVREGGAFANDGGLMAYGPSFPDMYNIKTAKAFGITLAGSRTKSSRVSMAGFAIQRTKLASPRSSPR